jgi:uncharacterized membrane protein
VSTSPESRPIDKLATVLELSERETRSASRHQRLVERFMDWIARPLTAYLLAAWCVFWIAYNVLAARPFDPAPFPVLGTIITIYAAVVGTCVLIAQSREKVDADRRSKLELHINLVAEQKAAKIISLLEELRRDLPNVRDRTDSVANELQHEIDAQAVHSALSPEAPALKE